MRVARVRVRGPHLRGASARLPVVARRPAPRLAVYALHPAARCRAPHLDAARGPPLTRLLRGIVTGARENATLAVLRREDGDSPHPHVLALAREVRRTAVGTGVVGAPAVALAVRAVLHREEPGGALAALETGRHRGEAWTDGEALIVAAVER